VRPSEFSFSAAKDGHWAAVPSCSKFTDSVNFIVRRTTQYAPGQTTPPANTESLQVKLQVRKFARAPSVVRATQGILRHNNSATTIELYTQLPMAQRIAAQESVLNAILK
jgi:hypothetical protein